MENALCSRGWLDLFDERCSAEGFVAAMHGLIQQVGVVERTWGVLLNKETKPPNISIQYH